MSVNKKRVTELTLKAAAGSLSPEEQAELDAFLDTSPANRIRFEERIKRQRVALGLQGWDEAEKTEDESWSRISRKMAGIDQAAGRRVIFLRRAYAIAVTLVLAVTGAWLLWINRHHPSDQSVPTAFTTHNDILPGGNKATLTLSNGQQIVLNDASTGVLAEQGTAKVIKKDSGQLSYTLLNEKPPKASALSYNTLTTPKSGTFMVVLPDGSKVWLNAVSSLRYPITFSDKERRVELIGEAYFEIAKVFSHGEKKPKPFIVNILPFPGGMKIGQIEVFGTHFNVSAYPDEPDIKATLLEGAVEVTKDDLSVLLKPGQQAKIVTDNSVKVSRKLSLINDADVEEAVSWKNGIMSFKDADIKSIMRKISRWYDADVVYVGSIPERTFRGGIPRNLNLSDVLKVLELSNIHFQVEGRKIIVKP